MSAAEKVIAFDGTPLTSDEAIEYRNIVGGFRYLITTRPDISYAVNVVCFFFLFGFFFFTTFL
jgi:hypothetical protein